uniref:Uncharacterized protein n=1 Tax=Oryctolagus cuniculus TaxID=9986 RepID=A0A5F9DNG0_RABIT
FNYSTWKLELMFQKVPENTSCYTLKELAAIKSGRLTLYVSFKPVAIEHKETRNNMCAAANKAMAVIQEPQKQAGLEPSPVNFGRHGLDKGILVENQ